MESYLTKSPVALLSKTKVLIVDQDARAASMMSNVLNTLGFTNVYAANSGREAVGVMRNHKIDLVITDWELNASPCSDPASDTSGANDDASPAKGSSGAYLVRYLRNSKNSPNPYIPIIMLTGMGVRDKIEYARDSGVDEVLLKPVTAESLCTHICMVVDHDVPFVTSDNYKGPCRRRKKQALGDMPDRRKKDVVLVKHSR